MYPDVYGNGKCFNSKILGVRVHACIIILLDAKSKDNLLHLTGEL